MALHLRILSVHSFNKSIFLSLGGVGLLMVGFFWVGLALDFPALENAMVGLTAKHVVGYEVSVLLGSDARDEIVDKVFRTELAFSILQAFYSVLIFGLAFTKGLFRRLKLLALGVGIPLLSSLLLFWVKFLSDDHIISSGEKTELFLLSIIGASAGVALCWFGLVRFPRKTKISLDDFELPSEVSENKSSDDLLDALKERDKGKDGAGIESEQTEESGTAEEENDQPAADTNEEPPEESVEEEVPEAIPALPPETLPDAEEPEPIEEVAEAQPVVEDTEDVPPFPLPEIVEEASGETVEEAVPEAVPALPPEILPEAEEPEPIEEVAEAQPAVEGIEAVPPFPLPGIVEEASEETVEEAVPEAVPELPPETLSEAEEPEPIEEVEAAQPAVEDTEDIPPSPLPEIAEELPEESVGEEVPEVVPDPSPEAPLAQPAGTVELLPSDPGSPPDSQKSANPPPLDNNPVEVEGDEPSSPA
jgi:hypothetical protein